MATQITHNTVGNPFTVGSPLYCHPERSEGSAFLNIHGERDLFFNIRI